VDEYTVMQGEPVPAKVPTDTTQAVLVHKAISVTNWAVGGSYRLSPKTALFGGWAIDRSAYTGSLFKTITISNWNIYHVSFGSEFTFAALEFTVGATYSFGDSPVEGRADLETASVDEGLEGDLTLGEAAYKRIKVLVGFTLPIR
jgi:long-subunit fatty acid transport protein